jgi:hypothetical protein
MIFIELGMKEFQGIKEIKFFFFDKIKILISLIP